MKTLICAILLAASSFPAFSDQFSYRCQGEKEATYPGGAGDVPDQKVTITEKRIQVEPMDNKAGGMKFFAIRNFSAGPNYAHYTGTENVTQPRYIMAYKSLLLGVRRGFGQPDGTMKIFESDDQYGPEIIYACFLL